MKRLSIWAKIRNSATARRRLETRTRVRLRNKRIRGEIAGLLPRYEPESSPIHVVNVYRRGKTRRLLAHSKISMPENFCLIENHEEVVHFLDDLRHRLTIAGEKLLAFRMEGGARRQERRRQTIIENYIDFASLKRITPVSALVLASEYDRAMSVYRAPDWLRAVNIDQWSEEVFTTLDDVGFLALLGIESQRTKLAVRNGIYTVPFLSGKKVRGELIDEMIRDMAGLADSSGVSDSETLLTKSRVYDGLGEAIQNVEDHAYPVEAIAEYGDAQKWWMAGSIEPSKKRFTIAIYDHGVSIPVSLPRWKRYADFKAAYAKVVGKEYNANSPDHDGETIAQAVQLGKSSTGKPWHGKGLPVIRDIVENCVGGGTVRILSRNGEYSFEAGKQASHRSHKSRLNGTLVEWELLL